MYCIKGRRREGASEGGKAIRTNKTRPTQEEQEEQPNHQQPAAAAVHLCFASLGP